MYKVKKSDLLSDISTFSKKEVQAMIEEQVRQGNQASVSVFQNDCTTDKSNGGFDWDATKEGYKYWKDLMESNFDSYHQRFGKRGLVKSNYMKYTVKEEDLIGDISEFPLEIVQAMISAQVDQGNPASVEVFQKDSQSDFDMGGFNWFNTFEGDSFWCSVINGNFELYYQKYGRC